MACKRIDKLELKIHPFVQMYIRGPVSGRRNIITKTWMQTEGGLQGTRQRRPSFGLLSVPEVRVR